VLTGWTLPHALRPCGQPGLPAGTSYPLPRPEHRSCPRSLAVVLLLLLLLPPIMAQALWMEPLAGDLDDRGVLHTVQGQVLLGCGHQPPVNFHAYHPTKFPAQSDRVISSAAKELQQIESRRLVSA
ncbi:trna (uracil-5-)-methyltransferase, partial [Nannochloropsis gaditana CCMP526]|uniref:trna (uracil-5-)-methyltransferase n=1 Tax=Nannochloropsis gaditana (strain CCMP526) TaxID=1093141 RepID=UPI00029F770A